LERKHSASREEAAELRATIKLLDREKDELQQQVDEKTEDIMNLEAIKITLVRTPQKPTNIMHKKIHPRNVLPLVFRR